MNHGKKLRKFGRETKPRAALMRGLVVSLIEHSRITTTQAKAKSLRPLIEKFVTKGKHPSLSTTKLLASQLPMASVHKLIKELGPRFAQRNGGYTRIRALPQRVSDGARMAIIEFVE